MYVAYSLERVSIVAPLVNSYTVFVSLLTPLMARQIENHHRAQTRRCRAGGGGDFCRVAGEGLAESDESRIENGGSKIAIPIFYLPSSVRPFARFTLPMPPTVNDRQVLACSCFADRDQ